MGKAGDPALQALSPIELACYSENALQSLNKSELKIGFLTAVCSPNIGTMAHQRWFVEKACWLV